MFYLIFFFSPILFRDPLVTLAFLFPLPVILSVLILFFL
jgi:hypothetical protein